MKEHHCDSQREIAQINYSKKGVATLQELLYLGVILVEVAPHVGNWDTTASKTGVSIRNMCALRYRWTFRELLSTSL